MTSSRSRARRSSHWLVDEIRGNVAIVFDADNGALRRLELPASERGGNTVSAWLAALHLANVLGLAYRIFVCAPGVAVTMLSVTGVYIWWRKRRAPKMVGGAPRRRGRTWRARRRAGKGCPLAAFMRVRFRSNLTFAFLSGGVRSEMGR